MFIDTRVFNEHAGIISLEHMTPMYLLTCEDSVPSSNDTISDDIITDTQTHKHKFKQTTLMYQSLEQLFRSGHIKRDDISFTSKDKPILKESYYKRIRSQNVLSDFIYNTNHSQNYIASVNDFDNNTSNTSSTTASNTYPLTNPTQYKRSTMLTKSKHNIILHRSRIFDVLFDENDIDKLIMNDFTLNNLSKQETKNYLLKHLPVILYSKQHINRTTTFARHLHAKLFQYQIIKNKSYTAPLIKDMIRQCKNYVAHTNKPIYIISDMASMCVHFSHRSSVISSSNVISIQYINSASFLVDLLIHEGDFEQCFWHTSP